MQCEKNGMLRITVSRNGMELNRNVILTMADECKDHLCSSIKQEWRLINGLVFKDLEEGFELASIGLAVAVGLNLDDFK
jgi:hypothetical protein